MSITPNSKTSMANTIKIYLFPSLVTLLSMMIWRDVTELRGDIKQLLAQSNIDKTRIEQLDKSVQMLNNQVFKGSFSLLDYGITSLPTVPNPIVSQFYDHFFIHEEIYDVNKYAPKI